MICLRSTSRILKVANQNTLVQIANALGVDANCLLGCNLLELESSDLQEALTYRVRNFSRDDLKKLLQVCDISFP